MTALRAIVRGRVQGVYYRAFTERLARKLGLSGWVRNLPDRSVEVYAEGDKERLEELLKALHIGPPGAWVDDITTEWLEHTGKLRGFSVTG
ncbi:MAG: acylphosphatase [Dehalococcoidia bacterium]|nr:acylphosphatase [Dehalococcoidia bacterium]